MPLVRIDGGIELRCCTPWYLHSRFLRWRKESSQRFSHLAKHIGESVGGLPVRGTVAREVA
jgi:hypothetical protein